MPPAGRVSDISKTERDSHGCPACPHVAAGPGIVGSPNVLINGLPALRVGDRGIHAACCGANTWTATQGSPTVFINGRAAHRQDDAAAHCGGTGKLVTGSPNVSVDQPSPTVAAALHKASQTAARNAAVRAAVNRLFPGYDQVLGGALAKVLPLNDPRALATLLATLATDPAQFLSDTLEKLAGYGLDRLGGLALGDAWDAVEKWAKRAWNLADHIPGLRDYTDLAKTYADNLFDSIAYQITGQMRGFDDAPRGNAACPGQLPAASGEILLANAEPWSERTRGPIPFYAIKDGSDVTYLLRSVIEELAPVVWTYADDAPAISIEELRAHSDGWYGDYLRLDDAYARDVSRQREAGPYLTAWKVDNNTIQLEVGFLRAVSFHAHPDPSRPLAFEHHGDGERAYVFIQLVPHDKGDKLYGEAVVYGVVGTGHGHRRTYAWDRLTFAGSRVQLSIARGSHATGVFGGRRPSGPGTGLLNSDVYAGPDMPGSMKSSRYQIADATRAQLLYDHEGTGRWGTSSTVGKSKIYRVWSQSADGCEGPAAPGLTQGAGLVHDDGEEPERSLTRCSRERCPTEGACALGRVTPRRQPQCYPDRDTRLTPTSGSRSQDLVNGCLVTPAGRVLR